MVFGPLGFVSAGAGSQALAGVVWRAWLWRALIEAQLKEALTHDLGEALAQEEMESEGLSEQNLKKI